MAIKSLSVRIEREITLINVTKSLSSKFSANKIAEEENKERNSKLKQNVLIYCKEHLPRYFFFIFQIYFRLKLK